jgi:hypothetical protein
MYDYRTLWKDLFQAKLLHSFALLTYMKMKRQINMCFFYVHVIYFKIIKKPTSLEKPTYVFYHFPLHIYMDMK